MPPTTTDAKLAFLSLLPFQSTKSAPSTSDVIEEIKAAEPGSDNTTKARRSSELSTGSAASTASSMCVLTAVA
ncbi:hypothetical protein BDY17DRAFT_324447 [Neohortaea acidophila]|uniref:Uncharacterized protein n=1 Tax=Neohortaea acidophila TaxID=245834 RepID=A0A6A6PVB7_9PEZI|nr:uncharacterized protein BDY17DRAFT_324447 [Neohortaea acidophila]KAF2483736.1 hypothetical protein BDY17DRAFT_324447 [Neohortaea acidophila]